MIHFQSTQISHKKRTYASIKTNQEPSKQISSKKFNPPDENSIPTTNKLINLKTNNEIVQLEANIENFYTKKNGRTG